MFLLRCAFWLSVVYAAMFFGLPGRGPSYPAPMERADVASTAGLGHIGRAVVAEAGAGIAEACGGRELDCLRDAAGLTALVQTAIAGEPDYVTGSAAPSRAVPMHSSGDEAPMPPRDPRRRGRLTQ